MSPFPPSISPRPRRLLPLLGLVLALLPTGLTEIRAEPASVEASGPGFMLVDHPPTHLDVILNGRQVARYQYAWDPSTPETRHETYKPYLHIYDASGTHPITKGSGGDFTHHRGIFIGWNQVRFEGKSYDRWHMNNGDMVHRAFIHQAAGLEEASFSARIEWLDPDGKPLVEEVRSFRFMDPSPGAAASSPQPHPGYPHLILELSTHLSAPRGPVRLGGDPEHAGVQFRPANEVDRSRTTYLFPRAGADARRDLDYPWVGQTFTLKGSVHGVVHMNHPENPKNTRYSAYRDYGRFGAFLIQDIPVDQPLVLKYGFLFSSSELPSPDIIQSLWDQFADMPSASPVPSITRIRAQP